MRSAPAPSALLLLLLLLPPPSLAQEGDIQAMTIMNSSAEPNQISTVPPATLSSTVRAGMDAGGMTDSDKVVENKTQMNTDAGVSDSVGTSVATLETPTTAKGALQLTSSPSDSTATRAPADSTAAPTQANSASDVSLPKENATSSLVVSDNGLQMPTSVPTKPATTIIQDKAQSPVTRLAPEEGSTPTYPTRGVSHPTITAPALSISTSLAPIGSGTPSSVSKDGDQRTVTASGSSPTAGPTSMPSGSPSTQSTVSLDTSSELRPGSSLKPSITETPTLSARSLSPDTMWPMDTSSSPETVPSTQAPAGSSTPLTSAAPHDIHPSPSPTSESQRGFFQVHCDPPERFSKQLLVLNFTKTRLCNGSHHDDKLETVLCQAAKANFNPAHDQCHIWLAPVPEVQGLAVKEIRIQTKLLPQDMYESLKDKWDTLKEIGVSHMQLGEQGPPEEAEDRFSMPLIITIICMASFLLLVAVLYGCCHQRLSQRKDQQRLTEELQTVENGYHDNPTLEVMETSSEMQEKKVVSLNGELGDSWIVPLDNLIKDDLDEEEDTHL